ncbi:hypothetical protein CGC49_01090 [Capnocytophaga sp. H4358]|uniref:hypothetical protein n=1 Tax=Capnocytophaga sp. H4358 TaxID=1945658 RepID=UPI000BB1BE00|nr:hypothetical protein [Capnocytophaga sp. H4358]ATA72033.1 hypothetical protein CGC49_01090 [Capnocytophaga sp. H4358]
MKTITPKQIERLYEFTRQHYVEYFDVQTELVDHLANAIETHWQEFPDDDFETALQKEFRKFGVFGFNDIVEEKTKQMEKLYKKLLRKKKIEFFTFPKILLTLFISAVIYTLLSAFNTMWMPFLGIIIVFYIFKGIIYLKTKSIYKRKSNKQWLFKTVFLHQDNYPLLLHTSMHIILYYWLFIQKQHIPILFIVVGFTLQFIYTYIISYHIPKNSDCYFLEMFPEYKFELSN